MYFAIDILKGILMGIANIMPGVSGGTLAISLGIYDRIITSISHIFLDFRKSFQTLFPIMVGMGIGILCFTYIIEFLFVNYPFPVCMGFIGLILGGLPSLCTAYKDSMCGTYTNISVVSLFSSVNLLLFFTFAILTISMSFAGNSMQGGRVLSVDSRTLIILFFLGIIAAATMVIPGVSGTLVLMVLGYYYGILNAIKSVMEGIRTLDLSRSFSSIILLIPFGIGLVLGIFLCSKLVEYLLIYHAAATYSAIIGLIAASPIAIFISTGALSSITLIKAIVGFAILFFCLYSTIKISILK